MSPRIIHIPLSGGDRKAEAKGVRQAHGLHASSYRESVLIRSAAEAKIPEADRLECEAWNAIMRAGGSAMPSPGDPQAEPTTGKAINGGYDLLEAQCNRCGRVSLVALRVLKHPTDTPDWKLEAALYCEPCSDGRPYSRRQRAHLCGAGRSITAEGPRQVVKRPRENHLRRNAPDGRSRRPNLLLGLQPLDRRRRGPLARSGPAVGHRAAVRVQGLRRPRRGRSAGLQSDPKARVNFSLARNTPHGCNLYDGGVADQSTATAIARR
jgi:hypothetical protein